MADRKISELTNITGASVDDANDEIAIVDTSANQTKAITRAELMSSVSAMSIHGDLLLNGGSTDFDTTRIVRTGGVFALQTVDGGSFVSNDYRIPTNAFGALTHEWRIANSEAMRIDSSGNVGIGATADQISVTTGASGHYIRGSGYASFSGDSSIAFAANRTGNDGTISQFRKAGTLVGSISVTATTTAYNTSSDYRLKEDVQPMVGASDRVLALNPVNFTWKANGTRVDGFLAHEAQEVVPAAVTGEKDGEEMQAIDQSKLVPLLTAALQDALKRIKALEGNPE
jgi:hypothetical protein